MRRFCPQNIRNHARQLLPNNSTPSRRRWWSTARIPHHGGSWSRHHHHSHPTSPLLSLRWHDNNFLRSGLDDDHLNVSRQPDNTRHEDPTIYALSTAPGRAAIAIVRISGTACLEIYRSLCPGSKLPKPRQAILRTLRDPSGVASSRDSILDANALVLHFPAPRTVTGEDVLELHVHGGPAVVKAVLDAIPRCLRHDNDDFSSSSVLSSAAIRYAEPGEFTRRAFLNDRLDLTQIEALGDTLSADTEQQRRLAVRGSADELGKRYQEWQRQLLYARGELEALIDFSEDQHFDESPRELVSSISEQVVALRRRIEVYIANAAKGELLRNGISVALLGAPNAGKSSLLNRIIGREAAIVSREEGTTRDILDVGVDIGGWFCRLGDMAGLRARMSRRSNAGGGVGATSESSVIGEVEQEGIRRAKERALASDVVIVVLSFEERDNGSPRLHIEPEVLDAAKACLDLDKELLVVVNKTDLVVAGDDDDIDDAMATIIDGIFAESGFATAFPGIDRAKIIPVSCKFASTTTPTDGGLTTTSTSADPGKIQRLLTTLIATFESMSSPASPSPTTTTVSTTTATASSDWEPSLGVTHRQRTQLQDCLRHLNNFLDLATASSSAAPLAEPSYHDDADMGRDDGTGTGTGDVDIVAAAEHLRFAASCLARITGRGEGTGDVEEVLGVVFEKFCVGK